MSSFRLIREVEIEGGFENRYLLLKAAVTTWLTASKKKNLDTMKVLTSIEKLATITAKRAMMLQPRMMLRMM